jgi:hypothetical protein
MLDNRDARNNNPNTRAASLADSKVAEEPPATALAIASSIIKAKTIIHPSISYTSPFRDG